MQTRGDIRFLLNGEEVRLDGVQAHETLLDHLRLRQRLTDRAARADAQQAFGSCIQISNAIAFVDQHDGGR